MERSDLRDLRVRAGLSQLDLAEKLGVSRVQISRIERGVSSTPIDTLIAWHRACGYRLEAVGLEDEAQSALLAQALSRLDPHDVRDVLRLAAVWMFFSDTERSIVRTLITAHEHQVNRT